MGCYLSTSCFGRTFVANAIERCHAIAPGRVEISAPHHHQPIEELEAVLCGFRDRGIALTLHNYFPAPEESFVLNMAAADDLGLERTTSLVMNALRLSKAAGSPLYGIHAGYLARADAQSDGMFAFDDEMSSYGDALDRAVAFVNRVAPAFEAEGVHFLVENLFPSPKKRHSLFCSLDEIREFMARVPKSVGLLFDLGHMNVSSNIMGFDRQAFLDAYLEEFGDRLIEVHISENEGLKDEHLAVRKGSWQLDALRRIHAVPTATGDPRVYCVEARRADESELRESIELVDEIVA
ncbi:MAG: TIM barrel protein [Rhodospirillales bacterium]